MTTPQQPDPYAVDAALRSIVDQNHASTITNQMLGNAARVGGTGLALGIGARGLWGLVQQMRRNMSKPRPSIPAPVEVEIPVEEIDDKYASAKQAEGEGALDWMGNQASNAFNWAKDVGKKYMGGGYASSPKGHVANLPLILGAGLGGTAAGWTLSDWLLDKRRKQMMKQELEQAKQEYNDALFGKLSSVLDELYDNLQASEKRAAEKMADPQAPAAPAGWTGGDVAGLIGGGALTYAGVTGLAAALAAYRSAKSRSRRTLLEKAQKERQRARYEAMPSPMYAVPVPVQRDEGLDEESPFYAGPSLRSPAESKIGSLRDLVASVEAAHSGL